MPTLTRSQTLLVIGGAWLGIALWLPALFSRVSRDNPTVLGLYSTGYALLLIGFVLVLAGGVALLAYTYTTPAAVRRAGGVVSWLWQRAWLARAMALLVLVLFLVGVAKLPGYLFAYTFGWTSLALAGFALVCYVLIGVLAAPDLTAANALRERISPRVQVLLVVAASAALVIALFGQNLRGEWSIIDDHGVYEFLGTDLAIQPAEFPQLVLQSEIGDAFQKTRYRPSYWFLRLTETAVWRDSAVMWNLARLGIWFVFVACFWWLVSRVVGLVNGALCTLAMLTLPFWSDIATRIAVAEAYAILGLALYIFSWVRLVRLYLSTQETSGRERWLTWLVNLLGALITIGSKENFLLLLIPSTVLFGLISRRKRLDGPTVISTGVIAAYGFFIAAAVAGGLLQRGADVYANSIAPGERLGALGAGVARFLTDNALPIIGYMAVSAAVILSSYLLMRTRPAKWQPARRAIVQFGVAVLVLAALLFSQLLFYNGDWPVGNRYDFPGTIGFLLALVALAWLGSRLLQTVTDRQSARALVGLALALAFSAIIVTSGYQPLLAANARYVDQTRRFMGEVRELAQTLKQNPDASLVMESFDPNDAEPLTSLATFLRPMGVTNKLFVAYYPVLPEAALTDYDRLLINAIQTWHRDGSTVRGMPLFSPAAEQVAGDCFVVSFSGDARSGCKSLGRFYDSPDRRLDGGKSQASGVDP